MFSRKKRDENWISEVYSLTLCVEFSSIFKLLNNENIFIYFTIIDHLLLLKVPISN